MEIPDHLACLLRNLCADQEATFRTRYEKTDWFQIGKGVRKGYILPPCLFNLYAEYITGNAGWKKHKLDSRLPGEISITTDMQMTLMAEREQELKSLLIKVKEECEKAGLKLNIQKMKIMASDPIIS